MMHTLKSRYSYEYRDFSFKGVYDMLWGVS